MLSLHRQQIHACLLSSIALISSDSLSLALFLVNMEIPIVTTSIVGITNDLKGFSQSSWLATAYLLTYVGMNISLTLMARTSDCDIRLPDHLGET